MSVHDRRGTVRRRGKTWTAQLEVGADVTFDPATGERKVRRRFWTKGGFDRQRDAQRQLDAWRRDIAEGAAPARDRSLRHVSDLAARWLTSQTGVVRPTTHRSYSDIWRLHLAPFLGGLRLADIEAATIEDLSTYLRNKVGETGRGKGHSLSPTTVAYCLRVASTMFAWAVEVGVVSANPVEAASRRRRKGTAASRRAREASDPGRVARELPWGRSEVAAFLSAADGSSFAPLYRLALATGARRGELCGLRWSDVDLELGAVTFARARVTVGGRVEEGLTKNGQRRTVRIDAATLAMLRDLRSARVTDLSNRGGHVFTNAIGEGVHPQDVTDQFFALVRTAGLPPIRLHDLRHLHATALLDGGHSPVDVARRLGHSRTSITTDTYGHSTSGGDARCAETAAGWLAS